MTQPLRPLRALGALLLLFSLASCATVNNALDKSMSVFRPKAPETELAEEATGDGATENAVVETDGAPGAAAAPIPVSGSGPDFNTALMVVEVNGVKRKVAIELRPDVAPKTVANFKKLVNAKFYDGLAFHRAIRNYIVQTGDPASRSDDQKDEWGLNDVGYKIAPELAGQHTRGAVAMARPGDPDDPDKQASGSQFYICLRSQKRLDGKYNVFGQVTRGLDVLEAIGAVPVDTNDTPLRRVNIVSVRLVPSNSPELNEDPAVQRRGSKPEAQKGKFEKFIERIW